MSCDLALSTGQHWLPAGKAAIAAPPDPDSTQHQASQPAATHVCEEVDVADVGLRVVLGVRHRAVLRGQGRAGGGGGALVSRASRLRST